jgi:serine/threonine protein kinase
MEPTGVMSASVSQAPTITTPAMMTGVGMILGTAAYMSPEQAKGRPADKRSDVWSFGCVLYEMLTGRRAFSGQTATETLAAILEREVDWTRFPASTPTSVRILLRRALERDPKRRLHDIADARLELDDDLRAQTPVSGASPRKVILKWIAALGVTAIATGGAGWYLGAKGPSTRGALPD